ncbi:hypothetical protein LguiA_009328 [Lonicera macranthoides]
MVVKETLRLHLVALLMVSHKSMRDIEWQWIGYRAGLTNIKHNLLLSPRFANYQQPTHVGHPSPPHSSRIIQKVRSNNVGPPRHSTGRAGET